MAESLTLTTPQSNPSFKIDSVTLNWSRDVIEIVVSDVLGKQTVCVYSGTQAHNYMVTLNKADLSSNSFQKRVLNTLVSDGKLPSGTVTGSPE